MIYTPCAECGESAPSRVENLHENRILCPACSAEYGLCANCRQPHESGHFAPPSLGEPGFWICKPASEAPDA